MKLYAYGNSFWTDARPEVPSIYEEILEIELPKEIEVLYEMGEFDEVDKYVISEVKKDGEAFCNVFKGVLK
jgi:hypothetical protein